MARSCTGGANILATFWRPLGLITEVTKRLMHNILGIANIGDSLNHVHKIRGIGEILHGIVHNPSQLIPNEVKYAKTFRGHGPFDLCPCHHKTCDVSSRGLRLPGANGVIKLYIPSTTVASGGVASAPGATVSLWGMEADSSTASDRFSSVAAASGSSPS
jgi:hypothetical protein